MIRNVSPKKSDQTRHIDAGSSGCGTTERLALDLDVNAAVVQFLSNIWLGMNKCSVLHPMLTEICDKTVPQMKALEPKDRDRSNSKIDRGTKSSWILRITTVTWILCQL